MNKRDNYNEYMNEYMKTRWQQRRKAAIEFLGGKCVVCDTTENLQFDHIVPATKDGTVARMSSLSEEVFWREIDKCQLLCKDCHEAKTKVERAEKAAELRKELTLHGTGSMYQREKCRCEICKLWRRLYMAGKVNHRGVAVEPYSDNTVQLRP